MRRVTEAVGAGAEARPQEAIAQAQRGVLGRPPGGVAAVVVAVDGCQVPLEDGWQEMKGGRVAPLGPAVQTAHRAGRTSRAWGAAAICAGREMESAEEFWYRVFGTACRAGLGPQTRRVGVRGDGAAWIWPRAASFVGGRGSVVIAIVDLYHAYEHLWAVGRAVFAPPETGAARGGGRAAQRRPL